MVTSKREGGWHPTMTQKRGHHLCRHAHARGSRDDAQKRAGEVMSQLATMCKGRGRYRGIQRDRHCIVSQDRW